MSDLYYGIEIKPRKHETRLQAYRRTALTKQEKQSRMEIFIDEDIGVKRYDPMYPRVVGKLDDPR